MLKFIYRLLYSAGNLADVLESGGYEISDICSNSIYIIPKTMLSFMEKQKLFGLDNMPIPDCVKSKYISELEVFLKEKDITYSKVYFDNNKIVIYFKDKI